MMRCFFSCQQIEQRFNGLTFADFSAQVINDANIMESHPFVVMFGKKALNWKMTSKLQKLKEDISLLRGIAGDLINQRKK